MQTQHTLSLPAPSLSEPCSLRSVGLKTAALFGAMPRLPGKLKQLDVRLQRPASVSASKVATFVPRLPLLPLPAVCVEALARVLRSCALPFALPAGWGACPTCCVDGCKNPGRRPALAAWASTQSACKVSSAVGKSDAGAARLQLRDPLPPRAEC